MFVQNLVNSLFREVSEDRFPGVEIMKMPVSTLPCPDIDRSSALRLLYEDCLTVFFDDKPDKFSSLLCEVL